MCCGCLSETFWGWKWGLGVAEMWYMCRTERDEMPEGVHGSPTEKKLQCLRFVSKHQFRLSYCFSRSSRPLLHHIGETAGGNWQSVCSSWSWSLCFRLCGPSSLMAHSKILKYHCWELCSCLFVVHLSQLVGWIFISKTLFMNDLSTKQVIQVERAASARMGYRKMMPFISGFKEIKHLNWSFAARCFFTDEDWLCGWLTPGSCFP